MDLNERKWIWVKLTTYITWMLASKSKVGAKKPVNSGGGSGGGHNKQPYFSSSSGSGGEH